MGDEKTVVIKILHFGEFAHTRIRRVSAPHSVDSVFDVCLLPLLLTINRSVAYDRSTECILMVVKQTLLQCVASTTPGDHPKEAR